MYHAHNGGEGLLQEEWPESLKEFVHQALRLGEPRFLTWCGLTLGPLSKQLARGMNPKKQLEVRALAALVHHLCQRYDCSSIIDVGSGLVGGHHVERTVYY